MAHTVTRSRTRLGTRLHSHSLARLRTHSHTHTLTHKTHTLRLEYIHTPHTPHTTHNTVHNTQHTTHNTQHTTHNTQHTTLHCGGMQPPREINLQPVHFIFLLYIIFGTRISRTLQTSGRIGALLESFQYSVPILSNLLQLRNLHCHAVGIFL